MKSWTMLQKSYHKKPRFFEPEPEISDYASEDYYDNPPPGDREDFQDSYVPYPEELPTEEFPPSMVVEGDDAPVEVDFYTEGTPTV